jgi:hypothetical protein
MHRIKQAAKSRTPARSEQAVESGSMVLNDKQIQTIAQAGHETFGPDATVGLFGSRLDDLPVAVTSICWASVATDPNTAAGKQRT